MCGDKIGYLGDAFAFNLPLGGLSLWSPGILVILIAVWLLLVTSTGVSTTTFSRVSFHLHQEKL